MSKMTKLNETLSINNDIVNLSDLIADKILLDALKQKKQISQITGSIFVEDTFKIELYGEIKGLNHLMIHYILYIFDNIGEYSQWYKIAKLNDETYHYNSFSDYNEGYIQIVSAYVDGAIYHDFAENILHEVTHLYQYGMGMGKRENLYDNAIKMCSSDNEVETAVGRSVYYTFKHEQDAMVHQFYGYLLQKKPFGNIEKIIENSEYGNALDYLDIVRDNKEEAAKYIKQLGLTVGQWNKRIHFGYKRFRQKIYNAYLLYNKQKEHGNYKNESKTFELNLRGQMIFDTFLRNARKKYGDVSFGIEEVYSMWGKPSVI